MDRATTAEWRLLLRLLLSQRLELNAIEAALIAAGFDRGASEGSPHAGRGYRQSVEFRRE